jgi:DUF4097 and DUF4098 domain-containing protein YvlB
MPQSALSPVPLALVAGMSILASQACDITIKDGDVSVNQLHGRATQEWGRKYPFVAGGRVEVINRSGTIEVTAGPAGSVEVTAVLSARAMSDDRAKEILSGVSIDESTAPGQIKLTTVRGNGSGGFRVNYTLTVPPDARVEMTADNGTIKVNGLRGHVKAMGANGAIELAGLRGSVDAALVNGTVSVKMAAVTSRIRIESTNGRIELEVPKDAKATLNARSVNGGINVTGLVAQEASGRRIRMLESVLNGGGPEIDLRVTNGRISITGK